MIAIDIETIQYLRTLSPDPAFLQTLIEAFIADTIMEIPRMKEAYKKEDTVLLKHIAHKYKSSSRNLGATKLMLLCLHIENMVGEGKGTSPTIVKKLELLEAEAKQAVIELEEIKKNNK